MLMKAAKMTKKLVATKNLRWKKGGKMEGRWNRGRYYEETMSGKKQVVKTLDSDSTVNIPFSSLMCILYGKIVNIKVGCKAGILYHLTGKM